jgi:hypothetical protein
MQTCLIAEKTRNGKGSSLWIALVRPHRASYLQLSLPKSIGDAVEGFQQAIVFCPFLRLIKQVGLCRLGLGLLPVADPHADETYRLTRQFTVKK